MTELETLRRKLAEAEATLDAIRLGSVDALVVSERGEDRIRSILDMGSLADFLFNQVAQPIFILDENNHILRSNQPAQDLCGFNPVSLPFASAMPLFRPTEDGTESLDVVLGDWIKERRHIAALDAIHDHRTQGTRFYLLDANPVQLAWESSRGGIITLMDITDRKLAEIELDVKSGQLRAQFNLMKAVSDNIAEGLLMMDEEGKVIFQNPAALKLLGLAETDLPGRHISEVFRIESDFGEPIPLGPTLDDSPNWRGVLVGWNQRRAPVQYSFYPIKHGDEKRGGILVVGDISERLETEKRLLQSAEKQQQSQKMEAIGRLAGGIAHDFNNLLLAILGFTDLSLSQLEPESFVYGNLLEVKKAGEKAAELTTQLLAYSRKQIMAPRVRHVNEAVRDLEKIVGRVIGENIRLEIDLSEEELWASIDMPRLQQVLLNMALNARDAMPSGGRLSFRTTRLDARRRDTRGMVGEIRRESEEGLPPGSYAVVEISDTGHGMSEDVMERLFEPFFTTKEFGKGSGLGLSTAFGIVRQLGGYIQVFSTLGKGSLFKIILPLAKRGPDAPVAPRKPEPVHDGKGKNVLLVEDEDIVRKLLRKVLTAQGYGVIEARNGEDALAKLPGTELSMVVTDLIMDGMGGIELAENLSQLRPGLDILFMSGYSEDQHKLPLADGHSPHFLSKPFQPADFLAKVRSILEKKAAV